MLNTYWYIYTMEYYTTVKMNELEVIYQDG